MASRPATDVDWPVHQVFELLHEALVVTEAELDLPGPRILYANPAFSRMTGYSLEEILGQTPRFLQGPETDRRTIARLRRCLESGETFNGEAINYRKDGTPFMMRWYIEPIRAADGCITHFFAVQRDVTQELAANTQQRALEQAIEQLDDSVVLFGRDGRVGYVNDAFRRSWSGSEEP
ncbi:MAG: PAS domain S-box protein, partial [Acidobacteriota bacterium]